MKLNNETIREAVKLWIEDEAAATKKYGFINDWDTSEVTDMTELFYEAGSFNSPIGNWDVSKVTIMKGMFYGAKSFNQPIEDWDVSNITSMRGMFYCAESFNQPIANWNTSKVKDMSQMFSGAYAFNQFIGDWNTSKVADMYGIFYGALAFNQPLLNWDVSNVVNMEKMFLQAIAFNQPIGDWDVSNVTTMRAMFSGAKSFNQPIGDWDVSNVKSMRYMFADTNEFNQPLTNWEVAGVENMYGMFDEAIAFNQPIGDWNVSNVFNMKNMFNGATAYQHPKPARKISSKKNELDISWVYGVEKAFDFKENGFEKNVFYYNFIEKDSCHVVFKGVENLDKGKALIDTIIGRNGGYENFKELELGEEYEAAYAGDLFSISYCSLDEIVKIEKYDQIHHFEPDKLKFGISEYDDKLRSLIKGLDKIIYNEGEGYLHGRLAITTNEDKVLSFFDELDSSLTLFKKIVSNYDKEHQVFHKSNAALDKLIKGIGVEYKNDSFELAIVRENIKYKFYIYPPGGYGGKWSF